MKRKAVIVCLFGGLSLVVVPAHADFQFLSQARSVSAQNSEGAYDSTAAPDGAPFAAAAGVSWQYTGPRVPQDTGTGWYSANALQDSVLSLHEITAQGHADDLEPFYHYVNFRQESLSDFHVVFATDVPGEFLLTGELRAGGDYGGTDYGTYRAEVEISNGAGTVFSASALAGTTPTYECVIDLEKTLTLETGVYTLDLRAWAEGWGGPHTSWRGEETMPGYGGSGRADYDIRLTVVPVPAVLPLALCGLGAVAFLKRRKMLQ